MILLPTAIAMLVTGIQLTGAINTGIEYRRLTEVAQLIDRLGTLSHEMGLERDLTAWYLVDRRRARYAKVQAQYDRVDGAKAQVADLLKSLDSGQGPRVKAKAAKITQSLGELDGVRQLAREGTGPSRVVLGTYASMIADFSTLHDELGRGGSDDRLFGDAVALGALTHAKNALSKQIAIMLVTLRSGHFDTDDLSDFQAAMETQETEIATFQEEAAPADVAFYDATVSGDQVVEADRIRELVLVYARGGQSLREGLVPTGKNPIQTYYDDAILTVNKMREVEKRLTATVVAETTALKDSEQRQAFIFGAAILIVLLVVLFVTSRVATSLVRPLRRLRTEALEIAGHRLPGTIQYLREVGDTGTVPPIEPIGVSSRDEVGEVARAFDEVHREAVRLAGDEARLRSNVNAMFVNLSRRSQTLVERQLSLIESLEQGEEDVKRLGHLFRLDHLATRMRRNSENLLVLAGQEPARRWSQPVPLLDIVRAAISEVENFERVALQVQQGASVLGQAVNDVVHLLSELVENAISFSPAETKVTVTSAVIDGGGLTVNVSDRGIGMSPEELAEANWRLANPPVVDVSVSRRMGLFVVGRLALRHGIHVQLRRQDGGGLTAMVLLPAELLVGKGARPTGVRAGTPEITGPMPRFGTREGGFGQPRSRTGRDFGYPETRPEQPAAGPGPLAGTQPVHDDASRTELPRRTPRSPASAGAPLGSPPPREPQWPSAFDAGAGTPDSGVPGVPIQRPAAERQSTWSSGFAPGSERRDGPPSDDPFDNVPHFEKSDFERGPFEGHPFQRRLGGEWTPGSLLRGGADQTSELPAVGVSPLESDEDEYLPIFASVESGWFRRADLAGESGDQTGREGKPVDKPVNESANESAAASEPAAPQMGGWSSPADAGWQAAQAASAPASGGVTASGLPRRVPKANLVPGSAASAAGPAPSPAPTLSPDRVRHRLSSFQQGIRRGRAAARGELGEGEAYPGAMPNRDGYKEDS